MNKKAEKILEKIKELEGDLEEVLSEDVQDKTSELKEKMFKGAEMGKEMIFNKAKEAKDWTQDYMNDYPEKSVLMAGIAGLVLGVVMAGALKK